MKNILMIALAAWLTLSATIAAEPASEGAPIPKDKAAEILKMLRLVGMEKLMDQMKTQVLAALKGQQTGVPEDFWKKFEEKFDTSELLQKIMPLYDKYYTLEDLKAVNAFYESASGQKLLSTLPQIMQESMKLGQDWGRGVGERVARELEEEKKKAAK